MTIGLAVEVEGVDVWVSASVMDGTIIGQNVLVEGDAITAEGRKDIRKTGVRGAFRNHTRAGAAV